MFDHVLFGTKGTHFGEYTVLGQISNNKNIVHNNIQLYILKSKKCDVTIILII